MSGVGYSSHEINEIAGWLRRDMSASQIARAATESFGREITRSAVVGVVHRTKQLKDVGFSRHGHGLGGGFNHAKPDKQHLHAGNIARKKTSRAFDPGEMALPVTALEPTGELVSLTDLRTGQCKWPVGDTRDPAFGFCGAAQALGYVYCGVHARRAYQFRCEVAA